MTKHLHVVHQAAISVPFRSVGACDLAGIDITQKRSWICIAHLQVNIRFELITRNRTHVTFAGSLDMSEFGYFLSVSSASALLPTSNLPTTAI